MGAYQLVAVGTDGSESSFRAVDRAATVAADASATLLIICAYHPAKNTGQAEQQLGEDAAYHVVGSTPAEETLRDAKERASSKGAGRSRPSPSGRPHRGRHARRQRPQGRPARHRQPRAEQPLRPPARLGPAGHLPEGADGRAHRPHHVSRAAGRRHGGSGSRDDRGGEDRAPAPAGEPEPGEPGSAEPESGESDPDEASGPWGEARREVEEFLLGGERLLRRGDVAERAGVALEQTSRLWSALGFPRVPDDVTAFAQADLDALALVQELLGDESLDEAEALAIARTLGQSMARLAEWQANLLRRTIAERGSLEDPDAVVDSVRTLVPLLEKLQVYTWRRHLTVTAGRMLSAIAESESDDAEPHRDHRGRVRRHRRVHGALAGGGRRRAALPAGAVRGRQHRRRVAARRTHREDPRRRGPLRVRRRRARRWTSPSTCTPRSPTTDGRLELRIGLAYGEVLPRYGDVYGPVVNIASRLTSHARPGHDAARRRAHRGGARKRPRRRAPHGPAAGRAWVQAPQAARGAPAIGALRAGER